MIEERRWPLGNKVTELYSGVERGSISSIKWKDTLIAWCNSESQVVMYVSIGVKGDLVRYMKEWVKKPTYCSVFNLGTSLHFVRFSLFSSFLVRSMQSNHVSNENWSC